MKAARDPVPRRLRVQRVPWSESAQEADEQNRRLVRFTLCLCAAVFVVLVPVLLSVHALQAEPLLLSVGFGERERLQLSLNGLLVRALALTCLPADAVADCWNTTAARCCSTAAAVGGGCMTSAAGAVVDVDLAWDARPLVVLGAAPDNCSALAGRDGYTARIEHEPRWTVVLPLLLVSVCLVIACCAWRIVCPERTARDICCRCCCHARCCWRGEYERIDMKRRHVLSLTDHEAAWAASEFSASNGEHDDDEHEDDHCAGGRDEARPAFATPPTTDRDF